MSEDAWRKKEAYWRERYEAAERRAFERHVLDLVRAYAELQEAVALDIRGVETNPSVREVELIGEHPDTRVEIRIHDRARDTDQISSYRIWDPHFRAGEEMQAPGYIASEILTWARGG